MRASDQISADSVWPYRVFPQSTSHIALSGDRLRLERKTGRSPIDLPVGALEAFNVRRSWFWKRLKIRTTGGAEYSVPGLRHEPAARLLEGVVEAARRYATEQGPRLVRLDDQLQRMLSGDTFVRKSTAIALYSTLCETLQHCGAVVQAQYTDSQQGALLRLSALAAEGQLETARDQANSAFVKTSIVSVRAAAPVQLPPLTEEQAEAVAADEDVTLVLAGAGTGKTAVIIAKVAHLVRNAGVSPNDILVLAYNRNAAEEIRNRLPGDLAETDVSTIHAFGRRVIAESDVAPTISKLATDDRALDLALQRILKELLQDPRMAEAVIEFLANCSAPYRSPFDFDGPPAYNEYVHNAELRTLSEDLVKSFEELEIANFLTENGVRFDYEGQYEHRTATSNYRQYQPDFYLPDYGIYIEHFALDEDDLPPPAWKGYAEGVEWKRQTHRRFGTKLIETHSSQYAQGSLFPALRERLEAEGVALVPLPLSELVAYLSQQRVLGLASLLATFLNHVKTANLEREELRNRAQAHKDRRRNHRFLDVFEEAYARYQQMLQEERALDFHDLINLAVRIIDEGVWESRYKYVLVDEFQDISAGRMALLQALKARGVAYFLVGDDWQSIYRFAGSDVRILRDCQSYLGHVRECTLSQTFRFGKGILEPATEFVQRNPEQMQRPLLPAPTADDGGIAVVSSGDPQEGVELALSEILSKRTGGRASVLVLGRYRRSGQALSLRPFQQELQIETSTIHRAKGGEADFVVVHDLTDGRYGFPSRVEDDPLMDLVLPPILGKAYPFAEERRLFYVAMTRARTATYLVTDALRPSEFALELGRESSLVRQIGKLAWKCPRCPSGRLLVSQSSGNLRCSNYPHCQHLSPRCPGCGEGYAVISERNMPSECTNPACDHPPDVCPGCGLGVLILREGRNGCFWGCSEFASEPSCRYTEDLGANSIGSRM